jgi:hypothetical protein
MEQVVHKFLEDAGLATVKKSVEIQGRQCVIRFVVEGTETLDELRAVAKSMPRGLFSEATKAAVKNLKELPSDLYLSLSARPPLFGREDDASHADL